MISGATRLYGFVGDPVAQAKSPQLMNAHFRRHRINAVCVPFHIRTEELKDLINGLRGMKNLGGLIVTIPHKFAIAELADELRENASLAGAANAVKPCADSRWVAELFDGVGFVDGLRAQNIDAAGKSFLVLGAGGAGSAIAAALCKVGAAKMTIVDPFHDRAEILAGKLRSIGPLLSAETDTNDLDLGRYDVVVNATPLGLTQSDPLPVDIRRLSKDCLVADVIMKPRMTRFLAEAKKHGCCIHLGHHMIDNQLSRFLNFFDIT